MASHSLVKKEEEEEKEEELDAMQMPDCGMATQVGKQGITVMLGSRLLVALIKAKTKGKH